MGDSENGETRTEKTKSDMKDGQELRLGVKREQRSH